MYFRVEYLVQYFIKLLPYLKITFSYAGSALFWGVVFGFVIAFFKTRKNIFLKGIANVYTAIFRSIPPVVLLFLVYYGLPMLIEAFGGIKIQKKDCLLFVIITISLLSTASISEIMRSAYTSVDKGQYEAAVSIGLNRFQAFRRIVLPQALYYAIPSMGNLIIYLIKEGSLGFTIGLVDIFGKANTLNQNTYSNYILEIYIALALLYWLLSLVIGSVLKKVESLFSFHNVAKG